jgi:uncharacterized phage infection (PIP) family protein YhgE
MNNDELLEKINKRFDTLEQGQKRLEQGQKEQSSAIVRLEQGVTQIKTVLKVLEAGQNDLRENMATKADVQDIKVELVKHQRRIENVEENTSTPNPHKN